MEKEQNKLQRGVKIGESVELRSGKITVISVGKYEVKVSYESNFKSKYDAVCRMSIKSFEDLKSLHK